MLARGGGHRFAGRHPRDLLHSRIALQPLHLRERLGSSTALRDPEVAIREGGDLGQVDRVFGTTPIPRLKGMTLLA